MDVSEIIEQKVKNKNSLGNHTFVRNEWSVMEWTKQWSVKAWASRPEKSLWVKKVPRVSHQGVLWAQEPWLLSGMAWERWGQRNLGTPARLDLGYWVGASKHRTPHFYRFLIQVPQTTEVPVAAICRKAGKERRGAGRQCSDFQFKPLFFVQSVILEARMKGRNKGAADSGVWPSVFPHALHVLITYCIPLISNP